MAMKKLYILICIFSSIASFSSCNEPDQVYKVYNWPHSDGVVITFHDQDGNNLIDSYGGELMSGKINATIDGQTGIPFVMDYILRPEKYYGFRESAWVWETKDDVIKAFPSETAFAFCYRKYTEKNHKVVINWSRENSDTIDVTLNFDRKEGWPDGLTEYTSRDAFKQGGIYRISQTSYKHSYSEELAPPTFVYKGKELPAKKLGVAPFFENYYYIDIVKELNN